jgi:hypothetical protein
MLPLKEKEGRGLADETSPLPAAAMAMALGDEALRRLGFYPISAKKSKETGQPNAG